MQSTYSVRGYTKHNRAHAFFLKKIGIENNNDDNRNS